jgi:DNA-binding response OmpR family regulator
MPKTVLIADDEEEFVKNLETAFVDEGFNVLTARNGQEGLIVAEVKQPDIILLDIFMPILDGFGMLKKLKEIPETKNIPVVVVSNLEDEVDVKIALDLGAKDYLVKRDFLPGEMVSKIKNLLSEI